MKKVVIIEESDIIPKILNAVFHNLGYQFIHFKDGETALDFLKENQVSIVISSLVFAGVSGYEIAEIIRKNNINHDCVIIIMTSNVGEVNESRLYNAGIDFILDKNKVSKTYILDFLNEKIYNIDKLSGKTVLVIDDSLVSRNFIAGNLKRHGFNTIAVENAEKGLDILHNEKVDIISLDIEMDGMNGFEFANIVRKDKQFHDIPIIAISGNYSLENIEKAFRAGIDEFLPKPFSLQKFLDLICSFFVTIDNNAESILVLDDSETILTIVGNMLKKDGYRVIKFHNPNNALEYLEKNSVSLIITDFEMPQMNGIDFVNIVKSKLEKHIETPVIFLTRFTDFQTKKTAYEIGIVDFIAKPFDSRELLLKINSTLKQYKNQQIAELEKNIKLINSFATTMGHYINNALSSIIGNSDLLFMENKDNEKLLSRLKIMKENALKINKTVDTLKNLKQIKLTQYADTELMIDLDSVLNDKKKT